MGPGAMPSPRLNANGLDGARVQKAAVVFPSHVRRSFGRKPVDYTGELVRLLDDISTVTHSIAAYVSERSESAQYGAPVQHEGTLDPAVATRKLYRSLSHDGYACLILEKRMKIPLRLYVALVSIVFFRLRRLICGFPNAYTFLHSPCLRTYRSLSLDAKYEI